VVSRHEREDEPKIFLEKKDIDVMIKDIPRQGHPRCSAALEVRGNGDPAQTFYQEAEAGSIAATRSRLPPWLFSVCAMFSPFNFNDLGDPISWGRVLFSWGRSTLCCIGPAVLHSISLRIRCWILACFSGIYSNSEGVVILSDTNQSKQIKKGCKIDESDARRTPGS
jgi:hypothetical protein